MNLCLYMYLLICVFVFVIRGGYDFIICFTESKHALENIPNETNVSYGGKDGQKLDIFFPKTQGKGKVSCTMKAFCSFVLYVD